MSKWVTFLGLLIMPLTVSANQAGKPPVGNQIACLVALNNPEQLMTTPVQGLAFGELDAVYPIHNSTELVRIGQITWISHIRLSSKGGQPIGTDSRVFTAPEGYSIRTNSVRIVDDVLTCRLVNAKNRREYSIAIDFNQSPAKVATLIGQPQGASAQALASPEVAAALDHAFKVVNQDIRVERWYQGDIYHDVGPGTVMGEYRRMVHSMVLGNFVYAYYLRTIQNEHPHLDVSTSAEDAAPILAKWMDSAKSELTIARVNLSHPENVESSSQIVQRHFAHSVGLNGASPLEIFLSADIPETSYADGSTPAGDRQMVRVRFPDDTFKN